MKNEYLSVIIQQDATLHSLFISANCSTSFGWYLHPSSGAHIILSTVSGIIETVTARARLKRDGTRAETRLVFQRKGRVHLNWPGWGGRRFSSVDYWQPRAAHQW